MVFAYAFALHTMIGARIDTKEIPLHWVRPSKVLAKIKSGELTKSDVRADDVRGVLIVKGSDQEIRDFQALANMFDVHRRSVTLKVSIDSKIDKESYTCGATILNIQTWKTSDDEIGLAASISPRINDDGSITLCIGLSSNTFKGVTAVVRVKSGETTSFSIGKNGLPSSDQDGPQIKITASIN